MSEYLGAQVSDIVALIGEPHALEDLQAWRLSSHDQLLEISEPKPKSNGIG